MKNTIFLFIAVLLVSCEARLDDDTRSYFKTKVVDSNGNPLRNAEVQVTTFRTLDFILANQSLSKFTQPDSDFILGQGMTDDNGEVSFTMLFDTTFRYFVNITSQNGDKDVVSTGIESFNDNLTLEIPLITIKDISEVQIDFTNTSGTTDVFNVQVNYFALYCNEFYENDVFVIDENCAFQNEIDTQFNVAANDGAFEFQAFYPSVINVTYTDESGNEFIEEFTINNPTERYEINY
jgi:hypothetical protein